MEIRNLLTFIRVAELCNFTKAANALGYTQSTVSFQIKQLEDELGCLLFDRIKHSVTLTDAGEKLLTYAQNICHLTEEFKTDIMPEKELEGLIHIVVPDSLCEDMLLTNFEDFHKKHPKIKLKFSSADTEDMILMLDRNEADIMLTLDTHIYRNDYIIAKEMPISMHFVTSAKSSLSKMKNLHFTDIKDYPLILTEKAAGYRHVLDTEMAKHSIEIIPFLEIARTDIITKLLEYGERISFLPDFVTEKQVKEGALSYVDICDFTPDIWKQLIYHKNKWISPSLKTFIEYVKKAEFR